MIDMHVHAMAHGEFDFSVKNLSRFIREAERKGIKSIGFSDHSWYLGEIDIKVIGKIKDLFPHIRVCLGLEVDHVPDMDKETVMKIDSIPFDYVIGSVHEIEGWMFDNPKYAEGFKNWDIDELYEKYFSLVDSVIESGIYNVIGHLDLIKIYGHRPSKRIEDFVRPVLKKAAQKNMIVEINTSGLYKPVKEIYPSFQIVKLCKGLGVNVTVGSDAHSPEHVGRDIPLAVEMLKEAGFREIVSFKNRNPIFHAIY
ncbi:MAG TPA: histidinol-phosphatase [Peptococcaceae bacterium]|nr:MAG: Histidinol-phosphatase [Clostridia bacterium 41_269]HBT20135.1 histidinol-phosphatase [Peptococcaceae bacterium]